MTVDDLSPRQWEALRTIAAYPEETRAQQARRMGIAPKTFQLHIQSAHKRLGTSTLVAALVEAGLLVPGRGPTQ